MSFSSDARAEIMRKPPSDDRQAISELACAFLLAGNVAFRGWGRYVMSLKSESPAVARYLFTGVKRFCGVTPQISAVRSSQLGDHTSYLLSFGEDDSLSLMKSLHLLDPDALFGIRRTPDEALTADDAGKIACLRGAFLACGWVNSPDRAYQLEFTLQQEEQAAFIKSILGALGFRSNVSPRKNQFVSYIKDAEGVGRLLATLGAYGAFMAVENARILKQLRGGVNRQTNCDNSNTDKVVQAAERQLEDITYLIDAGVLPTLPKSLRDAAEARVNNLDLNLTELGRLMDPPIGKSGVNNRLRRLSAIAEALREKKH